MLTLVYNGLATQKSYKLPASLSAFRFSETVARNSPTAPISGAVKDKFKNDLKETFQRSDWVRNKE
jgi:hypothetical protein